MNTKINTFAVVDLETKFPIIVIYKHPTDYPKDFVARVWNGDKPTELFMVKSNIYEIREDIKINFPHMVRLPRAKKDDPCIVETWL